MYEQHTRVADVATGISTAGAVTAWAADALPIVQFCAGVIAIIAGLFAIRYHYKKTKALGK
jgi:hypothetical protein